MLFILGEKRTTGEISGSSLMAKNKPNAKVIAAVHAAIRPNFAKISTPGLLYSVDRRRPRCVVRVSDGTYLKSKRDSPPKPIFSSVIILK